MEQNEIESIIKDDNCYIRLFSLDEESTGEIIKNPGCSDPLHIIIYYNDHNREAKCYFSGSDNSIREVDNAEAAKFMLCTHIQYFTGDGMNPDELIFILNNHTNYKGIKYKKNLIEISEQNIQDIQKLKDRDFEMFPIFEDNHWITGFIHFDQDGNQIGYYTFDSDIKSWSRKTSHKDISLKQDGDTQVLNDRNLQGKSCLCWLFTLECMKMAEDYKNFEDMQNDMFLLGQPIENKIDM